MRWVVTGATGAREGPRGTGGRQIPSKLSDVPWRDDAAVGCVGIVGDSASCSATRWTGPVSHGPLLQAVEPPDTQRFGTRLQRDGAERGDSGAGHGAVSRIADHDRSLSSERFDMRRDVDGVAEHGVGAFPAVA